MSRVEPLARIAVGVVAERRKAKNPWADFIWRPVAALPGVPDAAPWTELEGDAEFTNVYVGAAEIELFRSEVGTYRDNLATGSPQLWIVLRPTESEPPYEAVAVTADPSEGEAFTASPSDLVEAVPMPEPVVAAIAEFIAEHHVEHQFVKRQRDRADPEAMARRTPTKDRK
jgi:uncharacterized protein DUF3305